MAKININDLFGNGGRLFDPTKESAKDALVAIRAIRTVLKGILKASTELAKITPLKNFKNIQKVESALTKVAQASKLLAETEKTRIQVEREALKLEKDRQRQRDQQLKQQNKINDKLKQEAGILGQLKTRIAALKKEQLFAKTPQQLEKVNKKLERTQRELRTLSNVGKKTTNTFGKALDSFGFKFNLLSDVISHASFAITSFFRRGVGESITLLRDFEKQNAVLAGVLNTTREGVRRLTDDAQKLGSTTVKTASQVTSLQIAYSRLGFTQEEIIELTGDTINGSIALNAELDETAQLTGALVKSFDSLGTGDATKILDTLTLSTQKSATNFEFLSTALPISAGAADGAGVSFEKLVDQLGQAADRGIDASTAATSLRNIYLELAKKGLTLDQALKKINSSQDKLTTANELFGKRASVTALALASNSEKVTKFGAALENVAGTAEEVANTQLDTLDGAILLLQSAWEGLILSTNENDRITRRLAATFRFLAKNIVTIAKVLGSLVAGFALYKVGVIAATIVSNLFTKATKAATIATKILNLAMRAGPWGLLVTAVTAAVTAYILFTGSADDVAAAQEKVNTKITKGAKLFRDLFGAFEVGLINLDKLKDRLRSLSKEDLEEFREVIEDKLLVLNRRFANQIEEVRRQLELEGKTTQEINKELEEYRKILEKSASKDLKKYKEALSAINSELDKQKVVTKDGIRTIEDLRKAIAKLKVELDNQALSGKQNNSTLSEYLRLTKQLEAAQNKLKDAVEDANTSIGAVTPTLKDMDVEVKEVTGSIEKLDEGDNDELKKKFEERKQIMLASIDAIDRAFQRGSDKRLEALDTEIKGTIDRQAQLSEKANLGVLDAQESLASEQAKQRKLEAAKLKEKEKQELRSAAFQILSALISSGKSPGQAVGETGVLLAALPAVIDAIPGFVDGTGSGTIASEYGGNKYSNGTDGYLFKGDGKEKIFNGSEAAIIPNGMSNWDVATAAADSRKGTKRDDNGSIELLNEVKNLNTTIKNKKEYDGSDVDLLLGTYTKTFRKGNNTENITKKGGWIG